MAWFFNTRGHIILPLLILIAGIFLRVQDPWLIEQLRVTVFDQYQNIEPRPYTPTFEFDQEKGSFRPGVRIADLDDDTLEKLGQWPWPRTQVAELVAQLANLGAIAVVFDIVFAEPDRTNLQALVPEWKSLAAYKPVRNALLELHNSDLPDNDDILAEMLRHPQINSVTGFTLSAGNMPRRPKLKGSFAYGGDAPEQFLRVRLTGAVANITKLEEAAKGNGSFNVIPDRDGIVRRAPMLVGLLEEKDGETKTQLYPALSLESLRVYQEALHQRRVTFIVKSSGANQIESFGASTGIVEVKVGQHVIPTDSEGQLWVHYTEDKPERYIPIWKLFEKDFDQSQIAGHIVLIGTSAAGLKDIRSTPLNPAAPGVEVHANMLEQILLGHYLTRPDFALGAEVAYLFVVGVLLILLIPKVGAVWAAVVGGFVAAASAGASWYAYTQFNLLFDPVYPSLVAMAIYMISSLIIYIRSESERRNVRSAFGMYLSPDLVEQLADHPEQLILGGEMKEMTLLFCDIRGFTTISEQFTDPRDLTNFINRFLTPMTEIIMTQRGTIDKYMGDCIMAFWNAPLNDELHALNGCRSALEMCAGRDKLNAILKQEAEAENRRFIPVNIGIGLNTGRVCVGNMGSDHRFDYSVLGDDVNLASRLEGQSKTYGVDIVIGENTNAHVKEQLATLELDKIQVKGKTVPVQVYCVLGDEEFLSSEHFQKLKVVHEAMIACYRRMEWDKARALIAEARKLGETRIDFLYDLYEERISEFKANPLPDDWDGVYVATSK